MATTLQGARPNGAARADLQPGRPAWKEPASPLYNTIKAVILGGITLSIVIPILLVVSTSLADDKQLMAAGGYVCGPPTPPLTPTRRSSAAIHGPGPGRQRLHHGGWHVAGAVRHHHHGLCHQPPGGFWPPRADAGAVHTTVCARA